ncbi:MAG: hypothetical protein AB8B99_24605 [Phormidesmis sp.]
MDTSLHSRSLEENSLESSGSELLDSFYYPLQTITCLHNQPVVDTSVREKADSRLPPNRSRTWKCVVDVKTPRERAVQRINNVLVRDRTMN